MAKRISKKKEAAAEPKASRPYVPGYGISRSSKGMLPWSHADRRLARSRHYWIVTASSDARPHSVPVWGVWIDGAVYFGGGPDVRWARNLAANPRVAVHLEKGDDVVILEGEIERIDDPKHPIVTAVTNAYQAKYEMPHPPPFWMLRPQVAFAWDKDIRNATRWKFVSPAS
ncbi:MAG: pyridoxamine 5'-phosphate oxidase family protein [Vicinamibacteria bacterium]